MKNYPKKVCVMLLVLSVVSLQTPTYLFAASAGEQVVPEQGMEEKTEVVSELAVEENPEVVPELAVEENIEVVNELNIEENAEEASEILIPKASAKPSKNVIRQGDNLQIRVSGLDIVAGDNNFVSDISYLWLSEKQMPNRRLESVEIPYITATGIDGEPYNVEVYHMSIIPAGRYWVTDPFRITEEEQTHIITRAEMMPFVNDVNNGEWPSSMYLLFDGVPKSYTGEPKPSITAKKLSYTFHGDLVFNYTITNEKPYSTKYYDFFQGKYNYIIRKESDKSIVAAEDESASKGNHYSYLYHETSNVSIAANKTEDLIPGEEIELTFTIDNVGDVQNRLTMNLEVEGLELVPGSTDEQVNLALWRGSENNFSLPIADMQNSWLGIGEHTSVSFTQKFKIKDDYQGNEIIISPGLSAVDMGEFAFNDDFILRLANDGEPDPEPGEPGEPGGPGEPDNPGDGKEPSGPSVEDKPEDSNVATLPKTGEQVSEYMFGGVVLIGVSFYILKVRRRKKISE